MSQDGADVCGGVWYRQCSPNSTTVGTNSSASESSWVCYNNHLQIISCVCAPALIAIRKLQIQGQDGHGDVV